MNHVVRYMAVWVCLVALGCGGNRKEPIVAEDTSKETPIIKEDPLPKLLERLKENNATRREAIVKELLKTPENPKLIPGLITLLDDPSSAPLGKYFPGQLLSTRQACVKALLDLGPSGVAALTEKGLPILRKGLSDEKANVREHTAYAIQLMGAKAIPAREDLLARLTDSQKEVRRAAYAALEAIGSIPEEPIVKLLSNKEISIASDAAEVLGWVKPKQDQSIPLLLTALKYDGPKDADPATVQFIRMQAAEALAEFGNRASAAVPELIEILKKASVEEIQAEIRPQGRKIPRQETPAMKALRRIGKASVPALIPLLQRPEYQIRWQAATTLGNIGPDASEAVDALQATLTREMDAFLVVAACAIAQVKIGADLERPLQRLTELLKHEQSIVRESAAGVLQRFGRHAAPAAEKLAELLGDADEAVRQQAIETLSTLGPVASVALPELKKRFDDPKEPNRNAILEVIANFGKVEPDAQQMLEKSLKSNEENEIDAALKAIVQLGSAAKPLLPELRKMLEKKPERKFLLEAISAIGSDAKELAPELRKSLDHRDATVREKIVQTLGAIRDSNADTIAALQNRLQKDSSIRVRLLAIRSLAQFDEAAKSVIPLLQESLQSKYSEMRIYSAAALVRLNQEPTKNLKILVDTLQDRSNGNRANRIFAFEATEFLGANGKAVIPMLLDLLKDKSLLPPDRISVQQRVTQILGHLGETASPAVSYLIGQLDEEESLVLATIETLKQIGPPAKDAKAPLEALARTARSEIAIAATRALERIGE